jgi:hypothetical protein
MIRNGRAVLGTASAVVLLTGLMLPGIARELRTEPFRSIREHDALISLLADSTLCDTSFAEDGKGKSWMAYCDSGRVFVRMSPSAPPGVDAAVRHWSARMNLRRWGRCSSPVVFELAVPGREPLIVAMWREEVNGQVLVMRSHEAPGAWPPQWSTPLVMNLAPPRNDAAEK